MGVSQVYVGYAGLGSGLRFGFLSDWAGNFGFGGKLRGLTSGRVCWRKVMLLWPQSIQWIV